MSHNGYIYLNILSNQENIKTLQSFFQTIWKNICIFIPLVYGTLNNCVLKTPLIGGCRIFKYRIPREYI